MTSLGRMLRFLPVLLAASMPFAASAPIIAKAQEQSPQSPPAYKLGAGDKVRVTVFGEQSLNGEYLVGPDGTVALPLIGIVQARGGTITDLQQLIAKKLSPAYILDPRVSIDVINFRPFYILGEVSRPGSYAYTDSLSVAQAVAIAGGYTYRANSKKIFIRHADQTDETEYRLKSKGQVWVQPGDTVRIGERFF